MKTIRNSLRLPCLIASTFLATFALHAQIQTAGTVFVNVDATELAAGTVVDVTNSGTLGGVFEAKTSAGANSSTKVTVTNGVAAIHPDPVNNPWW